MSAVYPLVAGAIAFGIVIAIAVATRQLHREKPQRTARKQLCELYVQPTTGFNIKELEEQAQVITLADLQLIASQSNTDAADKLQKHYVAGTLPLWVGVIVHFSGDKAVQQFRSELQRHLKSS